MGIQRDIRQLIPETNGGITNFSWLRVVHGTILGAMEIDRALDSGTSGSAPLVIQCACGEVEFQAYGKPITRLVCYCNSCQQGSGAIEALPGARALRGPDGGTAVTLFRKDQVRCTKGERLLKRYKNREDSPTNRTVATCCNTGVMVSYDNWWPSVSFYQEAIKGESPDLKMRMYTKFAPHPERIPDDVPRYSGPPPSLIVKTFIATAAIWLSRSHAKVV